MRWPRHGTLLAIFTLIAEICSADAPQPNILFRMTDRQSISSDKRRLLNTQTLIGSPPKGWFDRLVTKLDLRSAGFHPDREILASKRLQQHEQV